MNIKKEARKIHKKELKLFRKDLLEEDELYYKEVVGSGYDNLHDYESDITAGLIKRILITVIITFVLTVSYVMFV